MVVSKCLEFAPCRYNGVMVSDEFVRRMKGHVTFCAVCPEVEIGLGCPRETIRVVQVNGRPRLLQPATSRDLTEAMQTFAATFLGVLGETDGFILKSRSPSCGIKDVKVYGGPHHDMPQGVGTGFFGGAVLERFPLAAVEDEGRLRNFTIREHFLTRMYTQMAFRRIGAAGAVKDLVRFQQDNKWLLMAYNQTEMRAMGAIVANRKGETPAAMFEAYGRRLAHALAKPPRFTSIINVLMHALGYVSEGLTAPEKAFFLDTLEKYRAGAVPLSVATALLKSWGLRFQAPYLLEQTFLEPYPEALVEITDSGKGREG